MQIEELPYDVFIEDGKDILEEYNEACDWIDSFGLNHSSSRFGEYKKKINNIANNLKSSNSAEEKYNVFTDYLNSFNESIELIRLKKAFSTEKHINYLDQLKKITSGKTVRNQSDNDFARNFAFELSVAARMINAGYEVDVSQLADIVVSVDSRLLFMECKRLTSSKQLFKRIKLASKQLNKRLSSSRALRARGLIAINVTDIINPDFNLNKSTDAEEMKNYHSFQFNEFMKTNESSFNQLRNKKILGVLCEYNMYGFIESTAPLQITNCRGVKIYQNVLSMKDEEMIRDLSQKISNQQII